jgi:sporulation protein YlmC with PRC-barrel domain
MLTRFVAAGIAGSLLLATTAFAAETSTTAPAPNAAATTSKASDNASFQGTWRASKIAGLKVYNDQNENVGTINDLLMDKSGNIKAAVISVGGFLGMGSRYVAVAFDKIKFSDQPVPSTSASNAGGGAKPMTNTTTTGSTANQPATAPASSSKSNPWYPDHAVFNATKDELKNMPEFKYSE